MSKYSHILKHYKANDPKIYKVMQTLNFDDWLGKHTSTAFRDQLFLSLCREIVGQQLSGKAATAIFNKFVTLFKTEANITPKNILKMEDQKLRDVGLSWSKVKYVKDLAQKVHDKEVNLEALPLLEDAALIETLTQVKGIGPWTCEMFMIFTLGRENIFSHGDLGLKKGLEKVYDLKINKLSKVKIDKIIKKWHPYKTYGTVALWYSLELKD